MSDASNSTTWGFETRQIHVGGEPDPTTGARAVPIYQTTSFQFRDSAHAQNLFALAEIGNIYTRIMNPTQDGGDRVVSFVVDGGPKVARAVVNERLDDGGSDDPQGWDFHPPGMGEIGGAEIVLAPDFGGHLARFLLWDRALLTTEAIAASRALRGVAI